MGLTIPSPAIAPIPAPIAAPGAAIGDGANDRARSGRGSDCSYLLAAIRSGRRLGELGLNGRSWPSTNVSSLSCTPSCEVLWLELFAFCATVTRPSTAWPRRATTHPSTTMGCTNVALKPSPGKLRSVESHSLVRT